MKVKISLWNPLEDVIETFMFLLGLSGSIVFMRHRWLALAAALIGALGAARLLTQAIGRSRLRNSMRYVTVHGLMIVGNRVPSPEYVEQVISETFEWLTENARFEEKDFERLLHGCVLEVIDAPLPEWCDLTCPWALLPWDSGKWMRCGMNDGRKLPALPHVLLHRAMYVKYGMIESVDVHEAADDVGFDRTG
jgi:hypothetical protein